MKCCTKPILDAGVGTGILGESLQLLGYDDVMGIDLSQGMLDIAAQKGCYSALRQMELGKALDFNDKTFAGIISAGVFTKGHAPPHSFDELLRITKPGGYFVFSARVDVYFKDGLSQKLDTLESAGKWKLLEVTDKFKALPFSEPDVTGQVFVYQVI